jgi:hypothetical protein
VGVFLFVLVVSMVASRYGKASEREETGLFLLEEHVVGDRRDAEQEDETDHVHHALVGTAADLLERRLHLFIDALDWAFATSQLVSQHVLRILT